MKSKDPLSDDCAYCGEHIGYGHPLFHLGNCGSPECRRKEKASVKVGKPIKGKLKVKL